MLNYSKKQRFTSCQDQLVPRPSPGMLAAVTLFTPEQPAGLPLALG